MVEPETQELLFGTLVLIEPLYICLRNVHYIFHKFTTSSYRYLKKNAFIFNEMDFMRICLMYGRLKHIRARATDNPINLFGNT